MVTIAIQAGGQSRRMGWDKGLMPLAGKPLIEHMLVQVDGLGDEILLTTNQPQDYAYLGLHMVSDPVPFEGALRGIHTSLTAARGDVVLVLACDMPFVSRSLLVHLLSLASRADIIIPKHGDYYEPLQAVYHKQVCLPAVKDIMVSGEKRIISLLSMVQFLTIGKKDISRFDPNGLSFFNVNTLEDLARAEQILAEQA